MEFLYLVESVRVPIVDAFMIAVTKHGEEVPFIVMALIIFWCVNKRMGYYILSVGFIGTITNQFLKLWFRIPRPWVIDSDFSALEEAIPAATGYSFPSGHTQSAVGTFGGIAYTAKQKWVRVLATVVAILVPFSRMYIGVHTPLDVFVSVAIALILLVVLKPMVMDHFKRSFPYVLLGMILIGIGYLCFVEFYCFPAEIDAHNYESGLESAYTLIGSLLGLLIVYIVDEKWLKFSTEAVWWAQIIKTACGFALVLAVKSGLKTPLNFVFGAYAGRAVRYMLVVLIAGIVWPYFPVLSKIR